MIGDIAKSALGAPAQIAADARGPIRPASAPLSDPCPECLAEYARAHPRQIFCSKAHKQAFERRVYARGVSLVPAAMAARITRGGSRGLHQPAGRQARRDAERAIDTWHAEDKAAGRMTMDAFYALRRRLGYWR